MTSGWEADADRPTHGRYGTARAGRAPSLAVPRRRRGRPTLLLMLPLLDAQRERVVLSNTA